ncbi:hypothetical protein K3495_g11547 [Podosphaera aphanis]|nr:hypothetical protein K3495_g11547 [Podosphaera aphanis]
MTSNVNNEGLGSKANGKADSIKSSSPSKMWLVSDIVSHLPNGAPIEGSESPIPFFHMLERLKTTPREGWRVYGVKSGESISDHMYRMALMTMLAPKSLIGKIDVPRCTQMALVHDMAELLVGDITPVQGIPKAEKNRREATTMDYLTKNLLENVSGGVQANEIRALWQEYEDSKTLESQFVHDVDKVELLLQMVEYERANKCQTDFGEFTWVVSKIMLPELKEWAATIMNEREELWAGREHISYTAIEGPITISRDPSKSLHSCGENDA